MKTNTRFLLGLLSSLCLACGFVSAAERLDPVSASVDRQAVQGLTPDSAINCWTKPTNLTPDTAMACWSDESGR